MATDTKWEIAIAVSWIVFLVFLAITAFAGEIDPFVLNELDSDIDRINDLQIEVLRDLTTVQDRLEAVANHRYDDRLRILEAQMDQLHGILNLGKWSATFGAVLAAAIIPWILARRKPRPQAHKGNGS